MSANLTTTHNRRSGTRGYTSAVVAGLVLLGIGAQYVGTATAAPTRTASFSDPAFARVWERTDRPVDEGKVARSWVWGPQGFYTTYEAYQQGPGGQHLVTYFDKSRMEINNPAGDRNSPWYVTNGLLVVDMIAGRIQSGDSSFAPFHPNNVPVAGDAAASVNAPTYGSLAKVASLNGDNRAANRTGQAVMEGLGRDGNVALLQNLSGYARYATYEATTGHNIPDVFWSYLNSKGPIFDGQQYTSGTVVDWLFALGYPITEPYWINISVNGQQRWVLMQAFQRRILTYSPTNPDGWKVEMGNVGRAYFDWRYSQTQAPAPAPTSTPSTSLQAAIGISPNKGDTNTAITVQGQGFPANTNVALMVRNIANNYLKTVATVKSDGNGKFSAKVQVPAEAGKFGAVSIVATAGNVYMVQQYQLQYNPNVPVTQKTAPAGGSLKVHAEGFPPRANLVVSLLFSANDNPVVARPHTGDDGTVDVTVSVPSRPVGSTFQVIVTGELNTKAASGKITVVAASPPTPAPVTVAVNNGNVYVGQQITVSGSHWKPGMRVRIGLGYTQVTEWVSLPTADAQGNFSTSFTLGQNWANAGHITLYAVGRDDGKVASVSLTVVPAGGVIPSGQNLAVSSYRASNGVTSYKLRAQGWTAGQAVSAWVISGDRTVNVRVAGAVVKDDGTLGLQFQGAAPWQGRNDLGVSITSDATGGVLSVRYLPSVGVAAAPQGGKNYVVVGHQLPVNTPVQVVLHIDGGDQLVASGSTDANGALNLPVALSKLPTVDNTLEVRTTDGQYSASFTF